MFVFKLKFRLSKKIVITATCVTAGIIAVALFASKSRAIPDSATCDEAGRYSLVAETVGGECGFLKNFGLKPDADSRQSESIVIPSEFNSAYEEYNQLQKQIGLNLENFKGKETEKITYTLENSENKEDKFAVLLVCKGRVIGGHLTNGEYGYSNKPLI